MKVYESEWTESGHRLFVRTRPFVHLLCQSRVLMASESKTQWKAWFLSQLTIPSGNDLARGERMVIHWLAFFEDPKLSELGLATFRKAIEEFEELEEPDASVNAPPNLN